MWRPLDKYNGIRGGEGACEMTRRHIGTGGVPPPSGPSLVRTGTAEPKPNGFIVRMRATPNRSEE